LIGMRPGTKVFLACCQRAPKFPRLWALKIP
jgi:hypothetical protein